MTSRRKKESDFSIVYIFDENCLGTLISYGAYTSRINYKKNGIEYELDLFNDEFEILEDSGIQYIEEDL